VLFVEQWRAEEVELRTSLTHLASELGDLRQEFRMDIRRLDDRIFQLVLLQLGTLAAAPASVVVALLS
jgi:hypothetical protein